MGEAHLDPPGAAHVLSFASDGPTYGPALSARLASGEGPMQSHSTDSTCAYKRKEHTTCFV